VARLTGPRGAKDDVRRGGRARGGPGAYRSRMRTLALLALAFLAACGGASDAEPDALPADYVPLAAGDWSLEPGQEGYYCVRATAPTDLYIQAFRPLAPHGTHHTALAIDLQGGADGGFPCTAADTGFQVLFGSGLGTEPFELPEGVAFKLAAGQQVLLNLHLYNVSPSQVLTGTSGVEVKLIPVEEVQFEAETIYAMDFGVEVPPGESVYRSSCTMDREVTIFGVFPHMHQLGTWMRGSAVRGEAEPEVFHDHAFDFEEQLNHRLAPPVTLARGDRVLVECGFDNPGTTTVGFGDSSDSEMCVLGLYRYPATGAISLCTN
jgi:hypothetical protein